MKCIELYRDEFELWKVLHEQRKVFVIFQEPTCCSCILMESVLLKCVDQNELGLKPGWFKFFQDDAYQHLDFDASCIPSIERLLKEFGYEVKVCNPECKVMPRKRRVIQMEFDFGEDVK